MKKNESCISELLYSYVGKLVDKGLKITLDSNDLYELDDSLLYKNYYPQFEAYYQEQKAKYPTRKLGNVLIRWFAVEYSKALSYAFGSYIFEVGIPILVRQLIAWLSNPDAEWYLGLIYSLAITVCYLMRLILARRCQYLVSYVQYKAGLVLRGIIYDKITRLSREGLANMDLGNLTNIMNHDTFKL